ncbi:hypothetical protein L873DRAFT_1715952 [Choiromyces venosus 120613-1]|uniref:Alpha box domain-containing protein n=1 Tax=Choiromyces venosus 120613-1 TaxID=1336337 RepID=A0A3N4J3B6_9PEZI|nr:hypothetical protein L873DRAFT_1715952 [Choiromyces venosus 120613-1]
MRNATLGCAMFLSNRGYILMQDKIGCVWVQHENAPVIIQPPGGVTFTVAGSLLPYDSWLITIQSTVRRQGRVPLDPEVPYVISVLRLYHGYYQPGQSWTHFDLTIPAVIVVGDEAMAHVPLSQQRALNPYVAQRSWISAYCNGLGLTQSTISSLTRKVWEREPNKYMWARIASLYTAARNRNDPGLVLETFIQTELAKQNHPVTPEKALRDIGFVVKAPVDKKAVEKAAARRKARAMPNASTTLEIAPVYFATSGITFTEAEAAEIAQAIKHADEENLAAGQTQLGPTNGLVRNFLDGITCLLLN